VNGICPRGSAPSAAPRSLKLLTGISQSDTEGFQSLSGVVIAVQQAEKQMRRCDVVVPKQPALLLRVHNSCARIIGESLEHETSDSGTPSTLVAPQVERDLRMRPIPIAALPTCPDQA